MALFEEVSDFSIPDKLKEFETFMDDVIQRKVGFAQEDERQAYAQILDVKNLMSNITQLIDDEARDLTCLTDLGGEFFVNAHIQDVSKMCVALVHGFYMEMPLGKLLAFLKEKLTIYEERHLRSLERLAVAKTELRLFVRALSTVADPSLNQ